MDQIRKTTKDRLEEELNVLMNNFGYGSYRDGQTQRRIDEINALLKDHSEVDRRRLEILKQMIITAENQIISCIDRAKDSGYFVTADSLTEIHNRIRKTSIEFK